jgi:NADH:ubiquinone oxidoreductase subunit 6 (subunit J)
LAARSWVVGIIGLFASWIALTFLSGMIGTMWGIYDELNQTGLIDKDWDQSAQSIKEIFLGLWNGYVAVIVFLSFIIYIVISSMRRRPEEFYE